ncbi:PutA NAD-dependent aldehyde dehydrogenase [Pyrenophora tritici-repentis]|uniref:Aldehyde dehydrogenase n=1 Tax=Pyrenophora tritici-repentis TaxID=45151 RepID=A0A2W1H8I8_9PLEO|nr:Aldehyde dehydrogenase [Pyrenophora tritici-repentis]KAF7452344.1 Aldehyde dehydrogenase [Pyrenophora tritici-repentis]KAF7574532.1 PutA, NAD-dependent aldehyde dehydrogenase [Pyrenophora tritici-repentis]KAG9386685.1 Aldehyde dehydrogenase [Pyrenophora tritici-repentis]KAI0572999.1 Aldehyde dehydrogenase [Pyrenophora tritici-repentis]
MSSTADSTVPLWIDNHAVSTSSTIPVNQASSDNIFHNASSASITDAIQAVESSWTAFKSWRQTTHVTRRDLILRVAAYYESHIDEFVARQIEETSCTEAWAKQNTTLSVSYLKEIAAQISSVTGVIPPTEKPNTLGFVFKEPIGPILCIAPWNAALILATRGIASAVAVGCTVVFKASELCLKTHFAITQAFVAAGIPPGVLNQIQCSRDSAPQVTESLIAHDSIRKVEFIGSAAVGRQIMKTAAQYLKPVLLELGGKCPALVLEDANLEEAAKQCALGAVLHHGQICFSTERIIVLEGAAEKFQELLVQAMKGMQGPAGSAVSSSIAAHAEDVIRDAQEKGEKILVGGVSATSSSNLSLQPTIILNPKDSRIVDEETFGPSASLYVVKNDEDAVALANRSAYGLNATVWTRDMSRFMKLVRQLEYGQVHANSISVYTSPTGSQGGVKNSGFGRQNGKWGLEEFVVEKFVSWCE